MAVMPGAVWRPITIPGGNPGARTKGRGVVLHVAASEATSLWSFFNNNPNANSHFYVNRAGVIEQYVDTDLQAWASMAANRTTISVETQGGVTNPDGEPWTAAQVVALGRICAWAHATEGIPLAPMTNSLPTSRGVGYHRLGIDPWRVSGGEVWSSSRGKLCPGAAKIAQIPAVIAAATQGEDVPLTPADAALVANTLLDAQIGRGGNSQAGSTTLRATLAWSDQHVDDVRHDVAGVLAKVAAVPTSAPVNVDPAALAAALLADEASVAKLGDAIAAGLARRVGNG